MNNLFSIIEEKKIDQIFELLGSLKEAIEAEKVKNSKKLKETWLDNQEVMEILKISPRTLQNLRDSHTLPFSKNGGKIYYRAKDIEKYLEGGYNG